MIAQLLGGYMFFLVEIKYNTNTVGLSLKKAILTDAKRHLPVGSFHKWK